MKIEIFKDIQGYPNYQISNLGRVKSLMYEKERILKPGLIGKKTRQYYAVVLHKPNKSKTTTIHRVVGLHFVNNPENKPQLNHIDNDPLNNHWTNLEWCTNRENATHGYNLKKTSSKYPGVHWHKHRNKWLASIQINGKNKHLGCFTNELEAAKAYQNALKKATNGEGR